MINPSAIMKIMGAKNKFESNHPKFSAFVNAMTSQGIQEGSVIEVKITRPDGTSMVGNMRVSAEDIELVNELKQINPNQ